MTNKKIQSEHGELAENVKEWRDHFRDSGQINGVVITLDRVIAALSAPAKFDILGHLRGGGKITRQEWLDEEGFIDWIRFSGNRLVNNESCDFVGGVPHLLKYDDWQPYGPEPTPAELIENARIAVMGFSGDTREIDKLTLALDAFEKLTLAKSDE